MSFELIFDHLRAAASGFILGALTAGWLHAVWQWWHPETIRFWGTWYTDSRLLVVVGVILAIVWVGLFFTS